MGETQMIAAKYQQGIIFDMDNTILASRIDFAHMKQATIDFVVKRTSSFDYGSLSVGQIIAWGADNGLSQAEVEAAWDLVADIEAAGMINAIAEPGAKQVLAGLQQDFFQLVLTNNAARAANLALEKAGLTTYFAEVLAREDIGELKPSPRGIEVIRAKHPNLQNWLLVGDAWLDGLAAAAAGIGFLAYGTKPLSYWQCHGVKPDLFVENWGENAVLCIQNWFAKKTC